MPQTTLGGWLATKQIGKAASAESDRVQHQDDPDSLSTPDLPPASTSCTRSEVRELSSISTPVSIASSSLPRLPPNVTIEPCRDRSLQTYRRMNALLLPIPYRDDFYKETIEDPVIASVTRLAFWHEKSSSQSTSTEAKLVAAIRCRILSTPPDDPYEKTPVLYISTITTLAPFRRHALGSYLLADVTRIAIEKYSVRAVMGHVWEANEEGMEWYKKRGFRVVSHEPEYYRRLAPKTAALVIRRDTGPGDMLQVEQLGEAFKTAPT